VSGIKVAPEKVAREEGRRLGVGREGRRAVEEDFSLKVVLLLFVGSAGEATLGGVGKEGPGHDDAGGGRARGALCAGVVRKGLAETGLLVQGLETGPGSAPLHYPLGAELRGGLCALVEDDHFRERVTVCVRVREKGEREVGRRRV